MLTIDQALNRMIVAQLLTLAVAYVLLYVVFMPVSYFALWVSETVTSMESHGYLGWHTYLVTIVYAAAALHLWNPFTDYLFDIATGRYAKC